jgi:hypothetical protein
MGIFDRHHQNKADAARDIAAASRHIFKPTRHP